MLRQRAHKYAAIRTAPPSQDCEGRGGSADCFGAEKVAYTAREAFCRVWNDGKRERAGEAGRAARSGGADLSESVDATPPAAAPPLHERGAGRSCARKGGRSLRPEAS